MENKHPKIINAKECYNYGKQRLHKRMIWKDGIHNLNAADGILQKRNEIENKILQKKQTL